MSRKSKVAWGVAVSALLAIGISLLIFVTTKLLALWLGDFGFYVVIGFLTGLSLRPAVLSVVGKVSDSK